VVITDIDIVLSSDSRIPVHQEPGLVGIVGCDLIGVLGDPSDHTPVPGRRTGRICRDPTVDVRWNSQEGAAKRISAPVIHGLIAGTARACYSRRGRNGKPLSPGV